ncbi:hypothetical protein COV11_04905 [Candidatus Woesearchaeota archaeon CG10_big_fil_rev_8_21_14_0_10_30_7]|nr:MAG: hypothetical protein COV11_04905 [Candidatus Woesearchaeota archaeon CG10_big_fil_rev_8_21_14_0_10_30_7]
MKRGLVLICSLLALNSCGLFRSTLIEYPKIEDVIKKNEEGKTLSDFEKHLLALEKYAPLTRENKLSWTGNEQRPFNLLNEGLEEFINKIYVINKSDFFHEEKWMYAHTHIADGVLCLPFGYPNRIAFHEAAHARHGGLDQRIDFSEQWKRIARIRYGVLLKFPSGDDTKIVWIDGTKGAKYGCLEAYGSYTVYEDVATFVEVLGYTESPELVKIMFDFSTDKDRLVNVYSFYFCNPADVRYKQKVDLLNENGFFTDAEYYKLINNLGCLHYLIRE